MEYFRRILKPSVKKRNDLSDTTQLYLKIQTAISTLVLRLESKLVEEIAGARGLLVGLDGLALVLLLENLLHSLASVATGSGLDRVLVHSLLQVDVD